MKTETHPAKPGKRTRPQVMWESPEPLLNGRIGNTFRALNILSYRETTEYTRPVLVIDWSPEGMADLSRRFGRAANSWLSGRNSNHTLESLIMGVLTPKQPRGGLAGKGKRK